MADWRIVVPTRNSSKYIGVFLDFYRKLGLEPLYIVDGRTEDRTAEILRENGADLHVVNPTGRFGVTELLQAACSKAKSRWIVRLDDDEFPSREMISYIGEQSRKPREATYSFNREWVTLREGRRRSTGSKDFNRASTTTICSIACF